jgi:NADP+-dependent farnesol dehydrogenase
VNNAGIIQQTNLTEGDTEKWKRVLDTNVMGLCIATREAVKVMKANKIDGHIIHINSIAGHTVPNFPGLNVYPASKHAVTALTETLRQEFNHLGLKIKITVKNFAPLGELFVIVDILECKSGRSRH